MATGSQTAAYPALRPVLLLFGAFAFAFCLGATVHELGHFAVDRLVGIPGVRVILHPFGAPRIVIPGGFPPELRGWPDAAGPLSNVLLSTIALFALWRWRQPILLPLLLWAPMAYVQEAFSSAVGLLIPGSDSAIMVRVGVPPAVVLVACALLFGAGLVTMLALFPLLQLRPRDSLGRKLGILAGGMGGYMVLLLIFNGLFNSQAGDGIQRGAVLLAFALLLAALLAILHKPLQPLVSPLARTGPAPIMRRDVAAALVMAGAIVVVELLLFNG